MYVAQQRPQLADDVSNLYREMGVLSTEGRYVEFDGHLVMNGVLEGRPMLARIAAMSQRQASMPKAMAAQNLVPSRRIAPMPSEPASPPQERRPTGAPTASPALMTFFATPPERSAGWRTGK